MDEHKEKKQVLYTRFNELLARKAKLEKRRISYRDVADESGVSYSAVRSWAFNEVTRFDASVLLAFAKYFGVTIGDLFEVIDEEPETQNHLGAVA